MILLAYNSVEAPTKPTMLEYIQKDQQPSILTKLFNKDQELKNFLQIVKKTIVTKTKVNLRFWAIAKNINQHYF